MKGAFDRLWLTCPACGKEFEFQSKRGRVAQPVQKLVALEERTRQMSLNFMFLIDRLDAALNALDSRFVGTWQQRADRVVVVAEKAAAEIKARHAG